MTRTSSSLKPENPPTPAPSIVGFDVSKSSIAIFDMATGRRFSVANSAPALRKALADLGERDLAVCEGTGRYERKLLEAAHARGLAIHCAEGGRIKSFIASHGGRAKTDGIDAEWIARFGAERFASLRRWSPPCPRREALADLTRHRDDLVRQRTQAKNRLSAPGGEVLKPLLRKEIDFLDRQIATVEAQCDELIAGDQRIEADHATLCEIPGVGPATARMLLALMPELGGLTGKEAASLAGLAPHPRQSGETDARRTVRGGRPAIRRAMFMAALSAARRHPTLSEVYRAMIARGRPARVALTALARRLVVIANARLRDARAQAEAGCPA